VVIIVWEAHLQLCDAVHLLSPTARERKSEPTIIILSPFFLSGSCGLWLRMLPRQSSLDGLLNRDVTLLLSFPLIRKQFFMGQILRPSRKI
jgi:hypothetical protein